MIRATSCIPEQRLQRMLGDKMVIADNPYSAPSEEPRPKRGATHHDFEFTEKGIRCRTGMELPKICLVTGSTDNLVPYRVALMQVSPFSKVIMFSILFFGLMFPVTLFFLNRSDGGGALQQILSIMWLPIALSGAFQLGVFLAMWISPRGVVTAFAHKAVRRRIRTRLWVAAMSGVFGVLIGGIAIMSIIRGGDWMIALLVTCLVALAIVIIALGAGWRPGRQSRQDLKCLKLKVVDYQSGQFEIAGFTERFLMALRRHREESIDLGSQHEDYQEPDARRLPEFDPR